MAVYDQAGIKTQGNALYPDNTNEEIAPIDLRAMNDNYADSFTFAAADTTISGNWSFSANVSIPSTPTATTHATSKGYVDNLLDGLKFKSDAMVVATTGNITLSGEQTIDGTLTSASRVLVWQQTDQTENGLYLSDAGAWARTTDGSTGTELVSAVVIIREGSTYADKEFVCTNNSITLGVTNITWVLRASTTSHNNLSGLQGGTSAEYYHLTSAEYTGLLSKSANETISGTWTFSNDVTAPSVTIGAVTYNGTDGTNGQVLTTNGAGALSFQNGGSPIYGTNDQIPFMNAGGTDFEYSGNFTFLTTPATLQVEDTDADLFSRLYAKTDATGGDISMTARGSTSAGVTLGEPTASTAAIASNSEINILTNTIGDDIRIGAGSVLSFTIDGTTQDVNLQANNLTTTGTVTAANFDGILGATTPAALTATTGHFSGALSMVSSSENILTLETSTNNAGESDIHFKKSRNNGVITSGDRLGRIQFLAHDGTDLNTLSSEIRVTSTGSISSNIIPSKMEFYTMDGSGVLSVVLKIDSSRLSTFSGDVSVPTKTPASAGATGTTGTITWDSNYIYICTATNTWKRVAIATW